MENKVDEAMTSLGDALKIDPNYTPAKTLLNQIQADSNKQQIQVGEIKK
jgi:hypothetical protein